MSTEFGTTAPVAPQWLDYIAAGPTVDWGRTSTYRFDGPSSQALELGRLVDGPVVVGSQAALNVLAVPPGGTTEVTYNCNLTSTTTVTIAVDLPADGSLQRFSFVASCVAGGASRIDVNVAGVAPTRVRPGERAVLVADLAALPRMVGTAELVLGVAGAADPAARVTRSATRSKTGLVVEMPTAGADGAMAINVAELKGWGFWSGPDGSPRSGPFSCGPQAAALTIALAPDVTTTTMTTTTTSSTTTSTTSTTRSPPTTRPTTTTTSNLCGPQGAFIRWLWKLITGSDLCPTR